MGFPQTRGWPIRKERFLDFSHRRGIQRTPDRHLQQHLRTALHADGLQGDRPSEYVEGGLLQVEAGVRDMATAVQVELPQGRAPLQHAPHDRVVHL